MSDTNNQYGGEWVPCKFEGPLEGFTGQARYSGAVNQFRVFKNGAARKNEDFCQNTIIATNFDGRIASLFKPTEVNRKVFVGRTTEIEIIPSFCVLGPRSWSDSDKVASLTAAISGVDGVLEDFENDQRLSSTDIDGNFDSTLLQLHGEGWKGKVFRSGSFIMSRAGFTPSGYRFEIIPEKPLEIEELYRHIFQVRSFFSFCAGADTGISEISFSAEDSKSEPDKFELATSIGVGNKKTSLDALLSVRFFGRDAVEKSMNRWLSLGPQWDNAKLGALRQCIGERTKHGDLLLDACRWFEAIPTIAQLPLMSEEERKELIEKVTSNLPEQYSEIKSRIQGALRSVHLESRREALTRVANSNPHIVRGNIWLRELVGLVVSGMRDRGKYAHGPDGEISRGEFEELVSQVEAINLVCFGEMMKAIDAPIQKENIIAYHPMNHFLFARINKG